MKKKLLECEAEIEFLKKELSHKNDLIAEIQKTAKIGYYIFEMSTLSMTGSPQLNEILGVDADYEITVESWLAIVHDDYKEEMQRYLVEDVVGKKQNFDKSYKIWDNKLQEDKWVCGKGTLHFSPDGEIIRMIGTIQDVSQHKKTIEKLQEADRFIQLASASFFVWKNDENWPVEQIDGNYNQVFGYSKEEFKSGKISYAELVHPDDLERVGLEVSTAGEKGILQFRHKPYRIISKDGVEKWVDDQTVIIRNMQNEITHYTGVIIDITDLVTLDAALKKAKLDIT